MPALGLQINSYRVNLGPKMNFGTQFTTFFAYALIRCQCVSNHILDIYFLLPDSPIPAAFYRGVPTSGGTAAIFLPATQYAAYIDLLRNENPVSAYIWTEKPEACHIYTGNEPVGEEEFRAA